MKTYYGTKRIEATPMRCDEYFNNHTNRSVPEDMKPEQEGYLVKYPGDGYESWSPDYAFEAAYRQSGEMSFGHAIEAAKAGNKIARSGWNGKNMWVALTPGSTFDARHAKPGHAAKHRADELQNALPLDGTENVIDLLPHFDMRAADGSMVVGWLASQSDMLAEDWMIVE